MIGGKQKPDDSDPDLVRDYELWTLIKMDAVRLSVEEADHLPLRTYYHLLGFEEGKSIKERQRMDKNRPNAGSPRASAPSTPPNVNRTFKDVH